MMKFFWPVLFSLVLLCQVIICYLQPYHNWDMLGYMGCTISIQEKNIDSIHSKTYHFAQSELNNKEFERLTSSGLYERNNFEHAEFFHEQLKLYWVKPLYVFFIFMLCKTGIPLTTATLIPSLLSLIFIGFLFFYWIRKYLGDVTGAIFSSLIILSPPFWDAARFSTPDALAASLVLTAFYFLIEKRKSIVVIAILIFSILVRIDLAVLAFITISFLYFTTIDSIRITKKTAVASALITLLIVILISIGTGNFGASLTTYYNFAGVSDSTLTNYFRKLVDFVPQLRYSHATIFIAIVLLGMLNNSKWKNWRSEINCQVILLFLFYFAIHFLLLPNLDDRFFIAEYLIFTMLGVKLMRDNKVFQ
jgi:hypothetical protein